MQLDVYKNMTIKELNEQFSHHFPFLKLEFFMYHHHFDGTPVKKEVHSGLYLEEASEFFKEGSIYFSPSTTVAELEQQFQIEIGLPVKVFRRSGDLWVETTQTEHLTLTKQNSMGAGSTRPVKFNLHTLFL